MQKGEIIRQIRSKCSMSITRGNILWAVQDDMLKCFHIYKENKQWKAKSIPESDLNADFLHCPEKYLDKTTCINAEWRQAVKAYHLCLKNRKDKIRELFQKNGVVTVTLKPTRTGYKLTVNKLIVESVYPTIVGRAPEDNYLYKVPLKLIDDIH